MLNNEHDSTCIFCNEWTTERSRNGRFWILQGTFKVDNGDEFINVCYVCFEERDAELDVDDYSARVWFKDRGRFFIDSFHNSG